MNTASAFDAPIRRDLSHQGQDFSVFGLPDDDYVLTIQSFLQSNAVWLRELEAVERIDPVILDVGANIGVTATLACIVRPEARIVAVEPSRKARRCLELTLGANGLADQVEVVAAGLGEKRGSTRFYEAQFLAGSHQVQAGYSSEAKQALTVPIMALDQLVRARDMKRVDLIKIDVEGFELGVLKGGRKTIRRFRPTIVMEFNSWTVTAWANQSPRALLDYVLATFGGFYYDLHGETRFASNSDDLIAFLHRNLTMHGCVDDIVIRPSVRPPMLRRIWRAAQTAEGRRALARRLGLVAG